MMRTKIRILALLMIISLNLYAGEISLKELKAEIQTIQEKRCPKGLDMSNPLWVKKKVTCLFVVDQYLLNNTTHTKCKETETLINEVLKKNTSELKDILKIYGWLNISKFGIKTDNEAWLIVQHSDHDPEFQASIAFLLDNLANIGETNPKNAAYLNDRVSLKYQHLGLKQKYGTQFIIKNNDIILQPYEGTLDELKARRDKMKLESLERYLNSSKSMYVKYTD